MSVTISMYDWKPSRLSDISAEGHCIEVRTHRLQNPDGMNPTLIAVQGLYERLVRFSGCHLRTFWNSLGCTIGQNNSSSGPLCKQRFKSSSKQLFSTLPADLLNSQICASLLLSCGGCVWEKLEATQVSIPPNTHTIFLTDSEKPAERQNNDRNTT